MTGTQSSFAKQVALQFPDELLHNSVPIFRALKAKVGENVQLYVLADTSYGRQALFLQDSNIWLTRIIQSCCVDEVAAQHVEANAMVHYGYACMSQ